MNYIDKTNSKILAETYQAILIEAAKEQEEKQKKSEQSDGSSKNKEDEQSLSKETEDKIEEEAKNSGLDEKQTGTLKKIAKFILPMIKKQSFQTVCKYTDILFLNQMIDSLADIYRSEKLKRIDPDKFPEIMEELNKDPDIKKNKEHKELDSRKDSNTSTDIDQKSLVYDAIWFTKKKDEDILSILQQLKEESKKTIEAAKNTEKQIEDYIKSNKLEKDVTKDDIAKYGTVINQMIIDKAKPEDIKKKVAELRNTVKESIDFKIAKIKGSDILLERTTLITEELKQQLLIETLTENDEIMEATYNWLLQEGFLDKLKSGMSKVKNKVTGAIVGGAKGLGKLMAKPAISGVLKGAGIAFSVFTLGIGATVVLKCFDFIEKYGKNMRNAVERQFTKFANSKGVIAKFDFNLVDDPKKKYSIRYYVTDELWRGVNKTDQLKYPTKDFVKTILNGEIGTKFRKRLSAIWDPVFGAPKEGEIDVFELIKSSEKVDIPEKQLKLLTDFRTKYETIKANCINKPKIDTRAKSLKDAVKDPNKSKTV